MMVCSLCRKQPRHSKSWCLECTQKKAKQYQTTYRKKHPQSHRVERLRKSHLTLSEYEILKQHQNSRCALCRKEYPIFDIDHDHGHCPYARACKECIRGLLCRLCNRYHLPWLEKNLHLQSEFVKNYLKSRPFLEQLAA
jgi:hypothetical protein